MQYSCDPTQSIGRRITQMSFHGKPMDADKTYKVAGWASVAEDIRGEPVWDVVTQYLRGKQRIAPLRANQPRLKGIRGNAGVAAS
jgi:sulfur-oxidizing protein SoxB